MKLEETVAQGRAAASLGLPSPESRGTPLEHSLYWESWKSGQCKGRGTAGDCLQHYLDGLQMKQTKSINHDVPACRGIREARRDAGENLTLHGSDGSGLKSICHVGTSSRASQLPLTQS